MKSQKRDIMVTMLETIASLSSIIMKLKWLTDTYLTLELCKNEIKIGMHFEWAKARLNTEQLYKEVSR